MISTKGGPNNQQGFHLPRIGSTSSIVASLCLDAGAPTSIPTRKRRGWTKPSSHESADKDKIKAMLRNLPQSRDEGVRCGVEKRGHMPHRQEQARRAAPAAEQAYESHRVAIPMSRSGELGQRSHLAPLIMKQGKDHTFCTEDDSTHAHVSRPSSRPHRMAKIPHVKQEWQDVVPAISDRSELPEITDKPDLLSYAAACKLDAKNQLAIPPILDSQDHIDKNHQSDMQEIQIAQNSQNIHSAKVLLLDLDVLS